MNELKTVRVPFTQVVFDGIDDSQRPHANQCYWMAEMCADHLGGRVVYGWRVSDFRGVLKQMQHHAVWADEDGNLREVTPLVTHLPSGSIGIEEVDIDFLVDDTPDTRLMGTTRFAPLIPQVATACEYLNRSEIAAKDGDMVRGRYWTDRANNTLYRHRVHMSYPFAQTTEGVPLIGCAA